MYFSGIDISVYLTNPPAFKRKADLGSEIRTLPITGRFIRTNLTFPWVTYQEYRTKALVSQTTGQSVASALGALLDDAIDEGWPIEDYNVLWQFHQDMSTLEAEIGSGVDRKSNYTSDGSMPLDAVAIQFSAEQEATPIFSPSFQYFETAMKASSLVQGAITLNYDERLERELLGTSNEMDIIILYKKEKELSRKNVGYYEPVDPAPPGPYHSYILRDVRFISRSHSVQPTADSIVETYQIMARSIE